MDERPPMAYPKSNTNAVIALVLGILSFFGGSILTGIPAWIIGKAALSDIDRGLASPNDRTIANVGKILGQVSVVLFVLGMCFFLLFFGAIMGMMAGAPGR